RREPAPWWGAGSTPARPLHCGKPRSVCSTTTGDAHGAGAMTWPRSSSDCVLVGRLRREGALIVAYCCIFLDPAAPCAAGCGHGERAAPIFIDRAAPVSSPFPIGFDRTAVSRPVLAFGPTRLRDRQASKCRAPNVSGRGAHAAAASVVATSQYRTTNMAMNREGIGLRHRETGDWTGWLIVASAVMLIVQVGVVTAILTGWFH